MKTASLRIVSPTGHTLQINASKGGELIIQRVSEHAAFVDICDTGLPKHEDGFDRLRAQVPASWAIIVQEVTP